MPADKVQQSNVLRFVIAMFLFWAALYFYVPTLAVHVRSLGAGDTMVGMVVGSYGLTQLILRIPLGVLSDRIGRRKVFVVLGFVAVALSSAGLARAVNPVHMLVFRGLAGVAASTWVASTVLFAGYYPAGQAVKSTAIMSMSSSVGQMVATLAGGYVAARYGTESPFWVAAIVAFIGFALLLPGAEPAVANRRAPSLREILSVLTLPSLLLVSIVAAVVQYAVFSTSYAFIPIYASEVLGLDSSQIGALTSIVLVPNALMAGLAASLSTRTKEMTLVTLGLLTLAIATALTPFITSFWPLLAGRALFGVGLGLTYPVLMGLSIKSVPQEQRASAMGAFQAIYALGMTVGPAISGFISDQLGLNAVFWVSAVACLAGLPLLSFRPKQPSGQTD